MSENCSGECSECSKSCEKRDLHEKLHEGSKVKKVIGIVSGKGGVGKSLVTSLLACKISRDGLKAAILDADITGPSIPTAFGLGEEKAESATMTLKDGKAGQYIKPVKSKGGIQIMSMNFLLPEETTPVIWRGPVISGAVRQFWTDVVWDKIDYLFVDMPPGTGDVPLTVFQSLPVDGIVIVSSPQDLVKMIVKKAYNMAEMMKIPVLGIVENYSYVKCPDCGKELKIFGESHIDEIAAELNVPVVGKMPIDMEYASKADSGAFDQINNEYITKAIEVMPE